jgi:hypothetical protein
LLPGRRGFFHPRYDLDEVRGHSRSNHGPRSGAIGLKSDGHDCVVFVREPPMAKRPNGAMLFAAVNRATLPNAVATVLRTTAAPSAARFAASLLVAEMRQLCPPGFRKFRLANLYSDCQKSFPLRGGTPRAARRRCPAAWDSPPVFPKSHKRRNVWTAVAERSDDTAFSSLRPWKAAWRFASRRSPKALRVFAKHPLAQLGEGQRDSGTGNFFRQPL